MSPEQDRKFNEILAEHTNNCPEHSYVGLTLDQVNALALVRIADALEFFVWQAMDEEEQRVNSATGIPLV